MLIFKRLIIVPEWNVKTDSQSGSHAGPVLIIVPEWNVKYAISQECLIRMQLIIVPEWNVKEAQQWVQG